MQVALFDNGLTGGKGGVAGVDKAATVTGDAIGVGHDDIGPLAAHLHVAVQIGRVAANDFIENQACRTVVQVRVPFDIAPQLGLRQLLTVVEDDPLGANIQVVIKILRQTTAIGVLDIHHRHPIGRLIQCRPTLGAVCGSDRLCRQQHGLPDQQQRQAINKPPAKS